MLDWFSGLVGYDASSLRLPRMVAISIEGEVEWESERRIEVEGSWFAKLLLRRGGGTASMREWAERDGGLWSPWVLELSGNPSKFLQGHNVFGPPVSELAPVVREVVRRLPAVVRPPDADLEAWPSVHRSRVDSASMIDLGSHRIVHEWLQHAGKSTRSRHGRAVVSGSTVYWGKSSRRWSLKAYCKFCELDDHPPAEFYDELKAYTEPLLRLEVTLRRPELKARGTLPDTILWEFYEKVVIGMPNEKLEVLTERVEKLGLGRVAEFVFKQWLLGEEVRFGVPESTFRRWRLKIKNVTGVDVSLPRDAQLPELERVGFDVEYLRSREVKGPPEGLQRLLFKRREEEVPVYEASSVVAAS